MAAPTLADARRAAKSIATEHGASRVLLYGSVARGEAADGSDIDLVAVFDDLGDYRGRHMLRQAVTEVARAAAGCDVDVRITDHPEWKHRSRAVANCLEHHISGETVTLIDVPAGAVNWDKEIGMPSSEQEEAERHLVGMREDLALIGARYLPDEHEAFAAADNTSIAVWRRSRHKALCANGALCIEHGLKALIAMEGKWPRRTHDPSALISQIAVSHRAAAEAVPEHVLASISMWRQAGNYQAEFDAMNLTDEALSKRAGEYISAALGLASAVIQEFERAYPELSPEPDRLAQVCQNVRRLSVGLSIWDGAET